MVERADQSCDGHGRAGPKLRHDISRAGGHEPINSEWSANVRFGAFRTSRHFRKVSHNRAHASQQEGLFDHLVGASEQLRWQLKAELPCSFLVHDQLKFGWRLNRQFRSIGTTQDSIKLVVHADPQHVIGDARAVVAGDEAAAKCGDRLAWQYCDGSKHLAARTV